MRLPLAAKSSASRLNNGKHARLVLESPDMRPRYRYQRLCLPAKEQNTIKRSEPLIPALLKDRFLFLRPAVLPKTGCFAPTKNH
jgi:hypothetical protein